MTDHLQHIGPGDTIRSEMINKLIDGAKIALDSQHTGADSLPNFDVSNTLIRAKNELQQILPRFAVVSINSALFNPATSRAAFLQQPAIKIGQPNSNTSNFAILQRPAAPGQIVPACVSGVSIVELSSASSQHQFAVPNDRYTMTPAEEGVARIVWRQSSPGEDGKIWALVSFPVGGSGGGSAPAPAAGEVTVPVIIPASNGLTGIHAERFELREVSNNAYTINGTRLGIARTGTEPLRVFHIVDGNIVPKTQNGNQLYYRDLTWQSNNSGWHSTP